MSAQQTPLTHEKILEMFRETRESIQETRESIRESAREREKEALEWKKKNDELVQQMKETARKISDLGSRIGEIIECMVEGGIVDKFRVLGYDITQCARNVKFGSPKSDTQGEIDLFLEDGEIAILIEVKTTLQTADVRKHMERIAKYRRCADEKGDKRCFVGAVAGAVVEGDAREFALENGMYVIVQSGGAVEIVRCPTGFQTKKW